MNTKKRAALVLSGLTASLALSACGGGSGGGASSAASDVKVAMVVHGAAGDAFWSDVKTGAEDAAKLTGVQLDYQSSGDLEEQAQFINTEISKKVDVLAVSIPNADALTDPIKKAEAAGISVIVLNAGNDLWKGLGASGFVGQDEAVAGEAAGTAMKESGATKMLCVNITQVIEAVDQRCTSATKTFGGPVETIRIDLANQTAAAAAISAKLESDKSIDAVLSLGAGVYPPVGEALKSANDSIKVATFDANKEINAAVKGGDLLFAVDQQPYIQGYQSIISAALLAEKNLLIGGGTQPVSSGPRIVTKATLGE